MENPTAAGRWQKRTTKPAAVQETPEAPRVWRARKAQAKEALDLADPQPQCPDAVTSLAKKIRDARKGRQEKYSGYVKADPDSAACQPKVKSGETAAGSPVDLKTLEKQRPTDTCENKHVVSTSIINMSDDSKVLDNALPPPSAVLEAEPKAAAPAAPVEAASPDTPKSLLCPGDLPQADLDDSEGVFIAVCGLCGATHLVELDFMGLGLDFCCAQLEKDCEAGAEIHPAQLQEVTAKAAAAKAATAPLTPEEQRLLYEKHAGSWQGDVKKDLARHSREVVASKHDAKVRYHDGQVVTYKGEKVLMEHIYPAGYEKIRQERKQKP